MYSAIVELAINIEKFRNYDLSFLGLYYFSITLYQELPEKEKNCAFAYHIHTKLNNNNNNSNEAIIAPS